MVDDSLVILKSIGKEKSSFVEEIPTVKRKKKKRKKSKSMKKI